MFNYGNLQSKASPSPEALIRVSNPVDASLNCQFLALIDPGAQMTCVPESVISPLALGSLELAEPISMQSFAGDRYKMRIYKLNVKLLSYDNDIQYDFGDIEVIAIPGKRKYGLIGRDILNQYKIILDGPNKKWSIESGQDYLNNH